MPPPVPLPRYGQAALSDVTPSVLAAMGVPGFAPVIALPPVRAACVLLVDGLGAEQLAGHRLLAPYLASLPDAGPVTAGFPATTATSITSIGTGLPPGEHGVVGYLIGLAGFDKPMNALRWQLENDAADLRGIVVPEEFQSRPTVFERAQAAGTPVTVVAPSWQEHSGLSRAALRGARFRPAYTPGDVATSAAEAVADGGLAYAYYGDLDTVGHLSGPGSDAWGQQLRHVDLLAAGLAERLPAGTALLVTADHGMRAAPVAGRVDMDAVAGLLDGVRLVGGEARARYGYTVEGAAADVLASWRERLGSSCWVAGRDEAVDAGWFGPVVPDVIRARIGDVIAASFDDTALTLPRISPVEARLAGYHGSMTAAEQLVPLLVDVA